MSLTAWATTLATLICLATATFILIGEKPWASVKQSGVVAWGLRWLLARVLLLVAGAGVFSVWLLR